VVAIERAGLALAALARYRERMRRRFIVSGSRGSRVPLTKKSPKIRGKKVDAIARSIEDNVLSVEPWEVRKIYPDFTPKPLRFVSSLVPERLLALKQAPTIHGFTL
jgi:hypothetical protein